MGTAKRVVLFLGVNIIVVVTISILIQVLGLQPYMTANGINYRSLLVFCALFGFGGSFISLQLSRWMAKRALGVVVLDPRQPGGDFETRYVETVSRICQRAGLSTLPEIGVYPSREVNAFATGPSRERSLLAVSSGLLENMDDRAVEGVLGHEVGHIANGDMVTMALLQGVVNTFVMFAARIAVFAINNFLRDDEGEGLGWFAQIALIIVLETVLMLLASPIIYWFSRKREYRADKASAEFTGRETMIHALKSLKHCSDMVDRKQPQLATMKINGRARGLVAALFASHPPLDARIKALKEF